MKMDMDFKEDDTMMEEAGMHKDKKHKLVTMEDVADCLEKDFIEEIADCKKYLCMAKIADKAHSEEDCHYLTEMSKDEFTHASFIHNFMVEHDMHIPEEHENEFLELKEKMKEFF